jgi:magnesium chelatase subunit D
VCAAFDVDGLRADIVMARTAVALAAWHGRDAVTLGRTHRSAARPAARRRRDPFDAPGWTRASSTTHSTKRSTISTARSPTRPARRRPGGRRARGRERRRVRRGRCARTGRGRARPATPRPRPGESRHRLRRPTPIGSAPSTVPGVGAGVGRTGARGPSRRPGRTTGSRTPLGQLTSLHAPRDRTRCRAAPAQPRTHRAGSGAARRRPARGGPRGPRGQPRAVLRRRVRVDGGPGPDVRGEGRVLSCCSTPTSAATRSGW